MSNDDVCRTAPATPGLLHMSCLHWPTCTLDIDKFTKGVHINHTWLDFYHFGSHFFQGYGKDFQCSGILLCQGTLENRSETMRNSKEPQGTSKTAKKTKGVISKGDGSLDALFSRLWERLQLFWTSHMSGYFIEPIRDNEDSKEAFRNVKKSP